MKSNCKRLAEYIRPVDERNEADERYELLGVSVEKRFIKSIANTVGTDWRGYKIIRRGQFCYIADTSRRGDKIGIALQNLYDVALVSQAYTVFEIIDTGVLLPEYLNLWVKRPEFDRYARYNSHGSVREIFGWEEMCNVELPVPPIPEQRKTVNAYDAIEKRIAIKRKIDAGLIELAKCKLTDFFGRYSGVEKVPLNELCTEIKAGGTPSRAAPEYWNSPDYRWVKNGEVKNNIIIEPEEYISEQGFDNSSAKLVAPFSVLMAMYCVSTPQLAINVTEVTTNQAICAMTCKTPEISAYVYYYLMFFGQDLINDANGSAQINLSKETISQYPVPRLTEEQISSLNLAYSVKYRSEIAKEIRALESLKAAIIAQLSR